VRYQVTYQVDAGFSPWGCLAWLIAFVLALGVAIAVWFIWVVFLREGLFVVVNVAAYPTSEPGVSRVVLAAGRDIGQPTKADPKYEKYWRPVAEFIERELGGVRQSST
jgi:hypothetical protein